MRQPRGGSSRGWKHGMNTGRDKKNSNHQHTTEGGATTAQAPTLPPAQPQSAAAAARPAPFHLLQQQQKQKNADSASSPSSRRRRRVKSQQRRRGGSESAAVTTTATEREAPVVGTSPVHISVPPNVADTSDALTAGETPSLGGSGLATTVAASAPAATTAATAPTSRRNSQLLPLAAADRGALSNHNTSTACEVETRNSGGIGDTDSEVVLSSPIAAAAAAKTTRPAASPLHPIPAVQFSASQRAAVPEECVNSAPHNTRGHVGGACGNKGSSGGNRGGAVQRLQQQQQQEWVPRVSVAHQQQSQQQVKSGDGPAHWAGLQSAALKDSTLLLQEHKEQQQSGAAQGVHQLDEKTPSRQQKATEDFSVREINSLEPSKAVSGHPRSDSSVGSGDLASDTSSAAFLAAAAVESAKMKEAAAAESHLVPTAAERIFRPAHVPALPPSTAGTGALTGSWLSPSPRSSSPVTETAAESRTTEGLLHKPARNAAAAAEATKAARAAPKAAGAATDAKAAAASTEETLAAETDAAASLELLTQGSTFCTALQQPKVSGSEQTSVAAVGWAAETADGLFPGDEDESSVLDDVDAEEEQASKLLLTALAGSANTRPESSNSTSSQSSTTEALFFKELSPVAADFTATEERAKATADIRTSPLPKDGLNFPGATTVDIAAGTAALNTAAAANSESAHCASRSVAPPAEAPVVEKETLLKQHQLQDPDGILFEKEDEENDFQLARAAVPNSALPYWKALRMGTLNKERGLEYRVLQHAFPSHRISAYLVVHAGSLHEEDHERGLAHLLEHCVFQGTRKFPTPADVKRELAALGMSFGGDINAYTDFHQTVYTLHSPTDSAVMTAAAGVGAGAQSPVSAFSQIRVADLPKTAAAAVAGEQGSDSSSCSSDNNSNKSNLERCLVLLMELVFHPLLEDGETLEAEKHAVLSEEQMRDSVSYRVEKKSFEHLHTSNKLPQRFPIGLTEQVKNFTAKDLRRFQQRWYRVENCTLVVVADEDAAVIVETIQRLFSDVHEFHKEGKEESSQQLKQANKIQSNLSWKRQRPKQLCSTASAAENAGAAAAAICFDVENATEEETLQWAISHAQVNKLGGCALPDHPDAYKAPAVRESCFQHMLLRGVVIVISSKEKLSPLRTYRDFFTTVVDTCIACVLHARISDAELLRREALFLSACWQYANSVRENCAWNALTVAAASPLKWREALTEAVQQVLLLCNYGVAQKELLWALKSIQKNYRDCMSQQASQEGECLVEEIVESAVSGCITTSREEEFLLFEKLSPLITPSVVQARCKEVFGFVLNYFAAGGENSDGGGDSAHPRASLFVYAPTHHFQPQQTPPLLPSQTPLKSPLEEQPVKSSLIEPVKSSLIEPVKSSLIEPVKSSLKEPVKSPQQALVQSNEPARLTATTSFAAASIPAAAAAPFSLPSPSIQNHQSPQPEQQQQQAQLNDSKQQANLLKDLLLEAQKKRDSQQAQLKTQQQEQEQEQLREEKNAQEGDNQPLLAYYSSSFFTPPPESLELFQTNTGSNSRVPSSLGSSSMVVVGSSGNNAANGAPLATTKKVAAVVVDECLIPHGLYSPSSRRGSSFSSNSMLFLPTTAEEAEQQQLSMLTEKDRFHTAVSVDLSALEMLEQGEKLHSINRQSSSFSIGEDAAPSAAVPFQISASAVTQELKKALVLSQNTPPSFSLPDSLLDADILAAHLEKHRPMFVPPLLSLTDEQQRGGLEAKKCMQQQFEETEGFYDADLDAFFWRFSNGAAVNAKRTLFEPNRCQVRFFFVGGESLLKYDEAQLLELGVKTLLESGVAGYSQHIVDKLCALWGFYINFSVEAEGLSFDVVFDVAEEESILLRVFELLHCLLVYPSWNEDVFQRQKLAMKTAYEMSLTNFEFLTSVALSTRLHPHDKRWVPASAQQIENYSLQQVQAAVRRQLQPYLLEVTVVGDFRVDELKEILKQYIGGLPERSAEDCDERVQYEEKGILKDLRHMQFFTENNVSSLFLLEKQQPTERCILNVAFKGFGRYQRLHSAQQTGFSPTSPQTAIQRLRGNPSYRYRVWRYIEEIVNNRLREEMREKRQLGYAFSCCSSALEFQNSGVLLFGATPRPAFAAKAWDALCAVIHALCTHAQPTPDEYHAAKRVLTSGFASSFKKNEYWMALLLGLQVPLSMKSLENIKNIPEFYEQISLQDIRESLRAECFASPMITLIAFSGPEEIRNVLTRAERAATEKLGKQLQAAASAAASSTSLPLPLLWEALPEWPENLPVDEEWDKQFSHGWHKRVFFRLFSPIKKSFDKSSSSTCLLLLSLAAAIGALGWLAAARRQR